MTETIAPAPQRRLDYDVIRELVAKGSRILDVGCGDGALMALLESSHGVRASGIEIDQKNVNNAVALGLSVVQGDADTDLANYPDDAFDYVILSQTLQATRDPRKVLENLLRIGRSCIVSFPNFGFWGVRLQLLVQGEMPTTGLLPDMWWSTSNIHFCTIRDFVVLCDEMGVTVERPIALNASGKRIPFNAPWWFWNLFGEQAVFLLRR
ncbi:methionine biosynthesis protein MetW [Acuticoccus sp. MNP-M23]|uniref:methionine biosynthesis protein MetW n=1 Tax=Acuticoccus sp. MNP-M23 TaxID=3072793 RepID=UPI0028156C11|nr:methionine biosynthesis protein MetW [Acuticoccus sp. MNP-M23]WMS42883.1 methionine biosynthesis protein MetW [Acuticoccus sp. MNP-M23]